MILPLVFVGIKRVDEDLFSSALKKKICNAAVKWVMLIIYGNRHVCAPLSPSLPFSHTSSQLLKISTYSTCCARMMNKLQHWKMKDSLISSCQRVYHSLNHYHTR